MPLREISPCVGAKVMCASVALLVGVKYLAMWQVQYSAQGELSIVHLGRIFLKVNNGDIR